MSQNTGFKVSIEAINESADSVIGLADVLMDDTRVEAGWGFFESVKKNAMSIKDNVSRHGNGTSNQRDSLENMRKGLVKWENQLKS